MSFYHILQDSKSQYMDPFFHDVTCHNLVATGSAAFPDVSIVDLHVSGNVDINGNLSVTGASSFGGNVDINRNLSVTGTSNFGGTAAFISGITLGSSGTPAGYLPSNLSQYQYTGFSSTVSGPWSATAATFTIEKLGKNVSLQSAAISITESVSAIIGFNSVLPAFLRPNISVSIPVTIINDSVQETGYFSVDSSSGQMNISRNIGAFTGAGTAGYRSFNVSYQSS
jgi:hypothetical protein